MIIIKAYEGAERKIREYSTASLNIDVFISYISKLFLSEYAISELYVDVQRKK